MKMWGRIKTPYEKSLAKMAIAFADNGYSVKIYKNPAIDAFFEEYVIEFEKEVSNENSFGDALH